MYCAMADQDNKVPSRVDDKEDEAVGKAPKSNGGK